MKKIAIALCAICLIVCCTVLPCFASAWDKNDNYQLTLVNPVQSANWRENTGDVMLAVNRAEELGLFGGMHATAILYKVWEDGFYICAVVPAGDEGSIGTTTEKDTNSFYTHITSENMLSVTNLRTYTPQAYAVYYLTYGGDWFVGDFSYAGDYLELSTLSARDGYVAVAFRDMTGGGWSQPSNMTYATGWQNNQPSGQQYELNGVKGIVDDYGEWLNATDEYTYTLDIPAIFDSMVNGARSIMGAFDIELFGMNVINVLIALLITAIVTFIVRKLVK